jgi:membrane protein YdbS with pleckstrin-like domain
MDVRAMERPEPRVIGYWRARALVLSLPLAAFVAPWATMLPGDALWNLAAVVGASLVLGVLVAIVAPGIRYRRLRFAIDEEALRIEDGVLIQIAKVVPASRLQHVDVIRGPLERAFGLASVAVYTAGGQAATWRIPGLLPARAESLRQDVLRFSAADRAAEALTAQPTERIEPDGS